MSAHDDDNSMVITVRHVYDAITDVREQLGAVKGGVEMLNSHHEQATASNQDHELRIRRLEKWTYAIPLTGIVATATAVAAIIRASGA